MELFMTDDLVGRGLPMFLPKGYTVWQELENYIKDKERRLGYLHVMTPCVGTVNLYKTSEHVPSHGSRRRVLRTASHELPSPYDDLR